MTDDNIIPVGDRYFLREWQNFFFIIDTSNCCDRIKIFYIN